MDLARLDAVARNPSVSARAAGEPFVGRREVFEFLLDHPEFATHVTRALRVARYRIWRTGDGLFVDDGWGATGQVFVVRAASGTRVLYARGEFQHKLLPAITGEAVVTINYDTQPAADGRDLLVAAISSQLRIDGPFGDLVVKLASAMATEKAEKDLAGWSTSSRACSRPSTRSPPRSTPVCASAPTCPSANWNSSGSS